MSATTRTSARKPRRAEVAGQLAADLRERGLDLIELHARISSVSEQEGVDPLTDAYLEEIESIRAAVSDVLDAITRARTRGVERGVNERWTYDRIGKATGLTRGRIGQIAPPRPRA
jgi:hypothetical protein